MTKINVNGKNYLIVDGELSENDLMLVNNPHPDSSLKNVVRICGGVNQNNTTYQKDNTMVIREWQLSWCKKIVEI